MELINPATEENFDTVELMKTQDVILIAENSKNIQKSWKKLGLSNRIECVSKALNWFKDNLDSVATDITFQMGKPITQSRNEVKGMIKRAEVCCKIAKNALEDINFTSESGVKKYIRRDPLGVVLNIAAWNYPLLTAVNVIVPSILAGNSVLLKHSSITPLCGLHFESAFLESGAPEGLVKSLLISHQTTDKLIKSGLIDHVSFTGSISGGREINQSASSQFIYTGLELGGKDPAYICEDADIQSAIDGIIDGVFYNAGQSCCAVERIYVHERVYDEFVSGASDVMNNLQMGNPLDETTTLGPLAQQSGQNHIIHQIKSARENGATIEYGNFDCPEAGYYHFPTILTDVNHSMDVMIEESFGPIVGIMPVKNDEEATMLMNDSNYGLTASVWTTDLDRAMNIGNQIETGTFLMNCCDFLDPELAWTGVKDSGKGCSLSVLGIQNLTRPKSYYFQTI